MARKLFSTGGFCLFLAFIACGISFFAPFWLENTQPIADKGVLTDSSTPGIPISVQRLAENANMTLSRGLWAVCGRTCQWFWEDSYRLQINLFSASKWHLATQVLYFVGCSLVLMCEIVSRIHLCCWERRIIHRFLGFTLLFSVLLQVAAMAVFGGGAWDLYRTKSQPLSNYPWIGTNDYYFGWAYWMTIPGVFFSLLAAIFFLLADCWAYRDKI